MMDNDNTNVEKAIPELIQRGKGKADRKTAWPFDIYQATGLHPVDYKYWSTPTTTSVGDSACVVMHAHAYLPSGTLVAADQVYRHETMRKAHQLTLKKLMESENHVRPFVDRWENYRLKMLAEEAAHEARR